MRIDNIKRTSRPSLPPLLLGALAFWAVVTLLYIPLFSLTQELLKVTMLVSAGLILILVGILVRVRYHLVIFVVVFMLLGILVATSAAGSYQARSEACTQDNTSTYTFLIVEDPSVGSLSTSYCAETHASNGETIKVRLYVSDDDIKLSFGDCITSKTKLKSPSEKSAERLYKENIVATAQITSFEYTDSTSAFVMLGHLRANLLALFDESNDCDALLKAILLGDRTDLFQNDFYQEVKVCGLAHLVAVSGAHLVIVSSFLSFLLTKLRLNRFCSFGILFGVLMAYLVITGFPISCLRAVVMSLLSAGAPLLMRRSSALSSLGIVVVLFIGLDPSVALSVSFTLSLFATLGIVLFMPLATSFIKHRQKLDCIISPLCMTLTATFLTFPVSVSLFSQFSLISPLANVIATPFLSVLCTGGVITLCLSSIPGIGPLLLFALRFIAQVFIGCVQFLSNIPYACIPATLDLIPSFAVVGLLSVLIWVLWNKLTLSRLCILGACLCSVALLVVIFRPATTEIVMLDVGQGDAFLLKSNNKTLLVDTGNQSSKLLQGLAKNNIYYLDAILITHPDDDHCGSLEDLKGIVGIGEVILAKGTLESTEKNPQSLVRTVKKLVSEQNIIEVKQGSTVAFGDFQLKIISPEKITEGGNEDSLCFILTTSFSSAEQNRPFTALFVGDAEKDIELDLAKRYQIKDIDLYKVAHHGSKNALSEELAKRLNPKISLISVGSTNTYGHPNAITLSLLEGQSSKILRTDDNGEVVCKITPQKVSLETMK